ncbi:MAG TPA: hypothetical protein VFC78_05360 [Tepidisphaeraceae bacterium]|nr:hypothetical protein [Tepidisphaeraceae bacterium]
MRRDSRPAPGHTPVNKIESHELKPGASQPNPPAVLDYRGPTPVLQQLPRHVSYARQGETITITVPAPPLAGQMVAGSLLLLACVAASAALLWLIALAVANDHTLDTVGFVIVPLLAALSLWGVIRALGRLIYAARHGRQPTVVRASPDGIDISARGTGRPFTYSWPRARIADVEARPGGLFALMPVLLLQVTLTDDSSHRIVIPWRSGRPMIEVEDNLRDVLHLTNAPTR